MHITIDDINRRLKNRFNTSIFNKSEFNINEMELFNDKETFIINNANHMIEHWLEFNTDTNIAFNKALEVFNCICENCNDSQIRHTYEFLVENVDKVRDAEQLINSIKYHNSRVNKSKVTKIKNAIADSIDNVGESINKISTPNSGVVASSAPSNNKTVEECYSKLLSKAEMIKECDRIISNYNKISKRFNIDKVISEITYDGDIYVSIHEICNFIDTYNINFRNKYNTSLETVFYSLNKNYINYSSDKIVEAVTDYYIFNSFIDEARAKSIDSVIDKSSVFDRSDFKIIAPLIPSMSNAIIDPDECLVPLTENDFAKAAKEKLKSIVKSEKKDAQDIKVKEMIDEFRKKCAEDKDNNTLISNLKAIITKLFTKTPEQIVDNVPSIMVLIRSTFILGSFAINPILGLVTLITNFITKTELQRNQLDKLISLYEKELKSIDSKLEKTNDEENTKRLKAYKQELEKDISKLKEYRETLYSEEENDKRREEESSYDFDDDFNFDVDEDKDDDDSLDESQLKTLSSMLAISELVSSINENVVDDDVCGVVFNNIFKFDDDTIDAVTDFSITVPEIIEKEKLTEALEDYREQIRNKENKTTNDYIRIDCINDNIYKLKESSKIYNINHDPKSIICTLLWIDEVTKANNTEYIHEMNFTNTLKLALTRLKNVAMKLTDKEKQLSNSIDVSVNNISKGLENAVKNDNREAIIKGTVLPSASKTIKIALATGAAWAINPAIAVIGAIGAFACSAKMKSKERQLVLDDIEIELKMCDRYLRLAEDKNDMKAMRHIEQTKRNLQRQQQRIKYKMNVEHNQNVPNVAGSDDD